MITYPQLRSYKQYFTIFALCCILNNLNLTLLGRVFFSINTADMVKQKHASWLGKIKNESYN